MSNTVMMSVAFATSAFNRWSRRRTVSSSSSRSAITKPWNDTATPVAAMTKMAIPCTSGSEMSVGAHPKAIATWSIAMHAMLHAMIGFVAVEPACRIA
jgi:hypothetical protein